MDGKLLNLSRLQRSLDRGWIDRNGRFYSVGQHDHSVIFNISSGNINALDKMIDGWLYVTQTKRGAEWRLVPRTTKGINDLQKQTLLAIGRSPDDPSFRNEEVTFDQVDEKHLMII